MYVALVPNRSSPPAYLLREGYREDGKVKSRTLANLSHWPLAKIERLRRVLRDEVLSGAAEGLTMLRSLPHGHVAAVLGIARKIGLDRLLAAGQAPARLAALVLAMVLARVIDPASKLATARQLDAATATSSLGPLLELGTVSEQELYAALDWLLSQQSRIESRLAQRHLSQGTLVLYDVSSTYFEGRTCPLARRGYSRDGKRDKLQIIFGLLCASDGCPVAVEVFEGNTGDPSTLATQVAKLKQRFHLDHVVLVGDRGMITEARVETVLKPAGLDWITALRAPTIRILLDQGAFQLSLFDERDLAEVTSPDFPDDRLVVCRNPMLAAERARKRLDLLAATEADLRKVAKAVARKTKPVRGADKIGLAAGAVLNRHKVAKHFILTITDDTFGFERNTEAVEAEGKLDGFYVIRTNLDKDTLATSDVVRVYKSLSQAERGSGRSGPSILRSDRSPPPLRSGPRPCAAVHARLLYPDLPRSRKPPCQTLRLGFYRWHDPPRLPGQRIAQGPDRTGSGRFGGASPGAAGERAGAAGRRHELRSRRESPAAGRRYDPHLVSAV